VRHPGPIGNLARYRINTLPDGPSIAHGAQSIWVRWPANSGRRHAAVRPQVLAPRPPPSVSLWRELVKTLDARAVRLGAGCRAGAPKPQRAPQILRSASCRGSSGVPWSGSASPQTQQRSCASHPCAANAKFRCSAPRPSSVYAPASRTVMPSLYRCSPMRAWCSPMRACGPVRRSRCAGAGKNPYVESFGSRVRDELLAVELFSCLAEAKVMVADWRDDYNEHRPHSALAMKAPARFARDWRRTNPRANRPPAVSRFARPPGSLRETPRQHPALPCNPTQTTDSHTRWTDERGSAISSISN
jgi:hypothetical protein